MAILQCFDSLATVCQIFRACSNTSLSLSDFRCKFEVDSRPQSSYGLILAVEFLRNDCNFQDLQKSNYEYEPLTRIVLEVQTAATLINM